MARLLVIVLLLVSTSSFATPPRNSGDNARSKFYDFSEQIIDGHIRRPTVTISNAREKAKFERLLNLKKSFLPELFNSSKERLFK